MCIYVYICVCERERFHPSEGNITYMIERVSWERHSSNGGEVEVDEVTYNYGIEIELHIANQYNSHFTTPKNEPQSLQGSDVRVCV